MVSARSKRDQTNSLAVGPQMVPQERDLPPPLIEFWIVGDDERNELLKVLRLVSLYQRAWIMSQPVACCFCSLSFRFYN